MAHKWICVFLAVAVIFCAFAVAAHAEGTEGQEVQKKSWFDLFKATGAVGIMLLLLSLVGTALLIQYIVNYSEAKLGNPEMLAEVEALLGEGNVDEAFSLANTDGTYAGKVCAGALVRNYGGYEEVKRGLEESAGVEGFRVNAKLSYLSLVGNIGPLLGLLGTVTGMIASFQVIETLKAPTPGDLAKGVYESLVNTTMGLFISIIFLTAYFFLKNKVSDMLLRINTEIGEILARTMAPEGGQK